jgi:hypothetical protein
MMNDRQAQKVNEAARKFAEALMESYRAVAGRAVSTQELNAELTQQFFNAVISNLYNQAEGGREMAQQLADQQRRQMEATQALAQQSVNAHMGFLDSMFVYYQGLMRESEGRGR